ncbi:IS4 family transposase [Microcoleus sp. Pol12A5]|uniref:IS4 family transposase n=1 Tax=Microcoleus sp. Pol12A5 TaxID=3055392 RepID=UPI002FD71AEC
MLPQFYQTHLQQQLTRTQFLILGLLLHVLQSERQVKLERLARMFPHPITIESRRRKLQRFLELPQLTLNLLWYPLITYWLTTYCQAGQRLTIAIDRTQWGVINILMVSLVWEQRAIPLFWTLLPKLGSSNVTEQMDAIAQVLPLLKNYQVVVLGDREFCSVDLANWLRTENLHFCLRLKCSHCIETEPQKWQSLKEVGLVPGISLYFPSVKVRKTQPIAGFDVAGKWKRKYRGVSVKEGWFILTNLGNLSDAIAEYKKRMGIEEMFRDFTHWRL